MKIPLLLQHNTRIGGGPTVMLQKGIWRIETNHIDSELRVSLDSIAFFSPFPDQTFELESDTPVKVQIVKSGSEKELTVYVHLT